MKKIYSLLVVMVLAVTSALAGPITSTAAGGTWSVGTTWVGGVAPGAGDDVYIVPGATVTVTADATINSITFTGTAVTARTLSVSTGVVLTVTTSITLDNAIANNTVASIAGAGTIDCASLKVGGTVTTGFTADRTIGLTSTITALNVSGNLTVRSEDEVSNQATSTFIHTSGTITVGGSVVIDAENDGAGSGSATATFNMNGGGAETGTLDIAGSTPFSTPGTGTATFDANGTAATVIYSGAAQPVRATAYRNLTLSGSGTKTMTGVGTVNGTMTLSGTVDATTAANFSVGVNLNVGSGTTLTVAGFNFAVTGTTTIDGSLISNSTTGTKTFDNLVINTGGVFNSSAVGEVYSMTGGLQVNGTGSITSGTGQWTFSGGGTPALNGTGAATITTALFSSAYTNSGNYSFASLTVTGSGNLTNNGTITVSTTLAGTDGFIQGATGVLNFGGASIAVNTFTATAAGNTVNYNGAVQTVRATTYSNLTLSGSGNKTVTGSTVNATLSMQGTAAAIGTSPTFITTSILEYAGSSAQTTTDVEFKAASGPRKLKINNSNGVSLHAARSLDSALILTNGILSSSAILTLNPAATVSGASDASFVDGKVKKIGAVGGTAFDFPVGKTGVGYMKISIANVTGATTEFTAQYVRASAMVTFDTIGLAGLGLQAVSNCEYWTLDRAVTTSSADVTLSWNAHSPCGSGAYLADPLFGIRVVHFNSSLPTPAWDAHGGGSPSGDASLGSVTWTGVSSFSPFALGALYGSQSGLPVMFSDVKAYERNRGVQIEWSNLTERDLVNYIVERSANGVSYSAISQQQPRSNNNDKESYSAFDAAPLSGANYYRVKVLEISGKVIYSKVIRVDIGRTMQGFTLYPNPVTGNQVSVGISNKQGQYTIKVMNTAGQEIYSQRIVHQGGSLTQVVELPSAIKPGVYNMLINGDNYRESKMFVVQ